MSKRQKVLSEVDGSEMEVQTTRVTRSGRISRPPPERGNTETPKRTTRRTRKSVVQELTAADEKNGEQTPEGLLDREAEVSAHPGPFAVSEAAAESTTDLNGNGAMDLPGTTTTETAPSSVESVPKKKSLLAPSRTQKTVIPLGKPKSGRVWKDRNKKRSGGHRGPVCVTKIGAFKIKILVCFSLRLRTLALSLWNCFTFYI